MCDLVYDMLNSHVYIEWPDVELCQPSTNDKRRLNVFWLKLLKSIYGKDFCECFRYCNPFYNRNDILRIPPIDDLEDEPLCQSGVRNDSLRMPLMDDLEPLSGNSNPLYTRNDRIRMPVMDDLEDEPLIDDSNPLNI